MLSWYPEKLNLLILKHPLNEVGTSHKYSWSFYERPVSMLWQELVAIIAYIWLPIAVPVFVIYASELAYCCLLSFTCAAKGLDVFSVSSM